jgi:hypothetical protein
LPYIHVSVTVQICSFNFRGKGIINCNINSLRLEVRFLA